MLRVADIIAKTIADFGVKHVFMVTGGGAMHLNDAFGLDKRFELVFNHHEQACAMAAESYCRVSNNLACVNVTTGPGGINAMNGVYGAYVDSIAMIVISGQIKRETMLRNCDIPLRQLGDQEVDIISLVKPITKYATVIQNPKKVLEVVQKALYLATNGRPGPVWIDVPIDIQSYIVDETKLIGWNSNDKNALLELRSDPELAKNTLSDFTLLSKFEFEKPLELILEKLSVAKSPVILVGTGIHIASLEQDILELAEKMQIPIVAGWNAYDLVPNDHPCYAGRPGTVGDRAGNFTVQNADFLLVLGCRLNIRQISYNWENFAKKAWIAHVDIDSSELNKPTLNTDLKIHADLREFIPILVEKTKNYTTSDAHKRYLTWCKKRVEKYSVLEDKYKNSEKLNPYYFLEKLSEQIESGDIVVTANGAAVVMTFQALLMKSGVRVYSNSGDASMGYELPAVIGAAFACKAKKIICIAGDGSIMMNLQELQTIVGYSLPIYIFLLNNNGYLSIRQSQELYFPDNILGIDNKSGLSFPNFPKLAETFGFKCKSLSLNSDIGNEISKIFDLPAPAFIELCVDAEQKFEPKLASRQLEDGSMVSPSLEDMFPFLSSQELANNVYSNQLLEE